MTDIPVSVVVLAAGQGSRMQSDLPKVLHRLAGVPLIAHALTAARGLDPEQVIVVAGHGAQAVEQAVGQLDPEARLVRQDRQLGTGHAVRQALPELEGFEGKVVVLYGDTPFIGQDTLAALAGHPADVVVLGFEAEDPGRYGRLVVGSTGLDRIVEYKDADDATRQIALCNSGVMALDAGLLRQLIVRLSDNNAAGEYYLTDLVALARAEGRRT
ncbi:MAG: NTP transferase domain-containing protein, partial [Paracoccus sp. (in: a-proteobacteria)]